MSIPAFLLAPIAAIFGLCIGSFLNVVIHRIPREEDIVFLPSHCPKCRKKLRWRHNIPIFSFLALRGRCAFCKAPIPWRYPLVEFVTAALFALEALREPNWLAWPFHLYFLAALIVSTVIDLENWIIPDVITLPGIAIGILGAWILPEQSLAAHALGALAGGGVLFAISWAYLRFTGKEGLGGGDIKFLAMAGAFLGAEGALVTLVLSSILGSLFGVFLMVFHGKGGKTAIPFGPFLAAGALSAFLFGEPLWKWYFHK